VSLAERRVIAEAMATRMNLVNWTLVFARIRHVQRDPWEHGGVELSHVAVALFARCAHDAADSAGVPVTNDTIGLILEAAQTSIAGFSLPRAQADDMRHLFRRIDHASVQRAWRTLDRVCESVPSLRIPGDRRWELVIDRPLIQTLESEFQIGPTPLMIAVFDGSVDDEVRFAEGVANGLETMAASADAGGPPTRELLESLHASLDPSVPGLIAAPTGWGCWYSPAARSEYEQFVESLKSVGVDARFKSLQAPADLGADNSAPDLLFCRYARDPIPIALMEQIIDDALDAYSGAMAAAVDDGQRREAMSQLYGGLMKPHVFRNGNLRVLDLLLMREQILAGLPPARMPPTKCEGSGTLERAELLEEAQVDFEDLLEE
jgi:hypothetical protein